MKRKSEASFSRPWIGVALVGSIVACADAPEPSVELPSPPLEGVESQVALEVERRLTLVRTAPASAARWGELGHVLQAHDFLDEAVTSYSRAAELDPLDYRWPYLEGRSRAASDLVAAVEAVKRARALAPDREILSFAHAELLEQLGRTQEAQTLYGAIESGELRSWARLGAARTALAQGELGRAHEGLESLLTESPDFAQAWSLWSQVQNLRGDPAAAGESARRSERAREWTPPGDAADAAVVAAGRSARWANLRGTAQAEAGDFEAAVVEFGKAMEWGLSGPELLNNYASALLGAGRPEEALSVIEEASSDASASLERTRCLALLDLARFGAAQPCFEARLADDVADDRARLGLALALRGQRDFEASSRVLAPLGPGGGEHPQALRLLGENAIFLGRAADALAPWRRGLELDPTRHELRYDLATALIELGRHAEAIERLEVGAQMAPNSSRFLTLLAWELSTAPERSDRQPQRALEVALRVRAGFPESHRAADVVAAALAATGAFDEAAVASRDALRLASDAGEVQLERAYGERLLLYESGRAFVQER